jgi:hypothetical protein
MEDGKKNREETKEEAASHNSSGEEVKLSADKHATFRFAFLSG